jgi:hypothetical protein
MASGETRRPQGPQRPPHITVNSGSGGDILRSMRIEDSPSTTTTGTPGSARQLLPQVPSTGQDARAPAGRSLYHSHQVAESSEHLLTPLRARGPPRPYQDYSPDTPSGLSSRRTSLGSAASRDSMHGPFASPFDDSIVTSREGSDEEINTQTVSSKYNIMPSPGLLIYPEDVEQDDYLHNPDPNDPDTVRCEIWSKRGIANVGGLIFITLGVLALFVAFPVM